MNIQGLRKDEELSLKIRELFEEAGCKRTNVSEFEEYDLYVKYRNFLQSSNVITFMDANGRLLALRPDITLSIIKNSANFSNSIADKFYYLENVYRFGKENREYYRVNQIGVEILGGDPSFENLEVISLALDSLSCISANFRLNISHMGFVEGLLQEYGFSLEQKEKIYQFLHEKNAHELHNFLKTLSILPNKIENIIKLISFSGVFSEIFPITKGLIQNEKMEQSWKELEQLYQGLCSSDCGEYLNRIYLDFSVVNDLSYYNGLIFCGYVEKIPKMILVGGRYDQLMKNMGKDRGGIGFGLLLDEIHRRYGVNPIYDVDEVWIYDKEIDLGFIEKEIRKKRKENHLRIRAEKSENVSQIGYSYEKAFILSKEGLKEVELC